MPQSRLPGARWAGSAAPAGTRRPGRVPAVAGPVLASPVPLVRGPVPPGPVRRSPAGQDASPEAEGPLQQ